MQPGLRFPFPSFFSTTRIGKTIDTVPKKRKTDQDAVNFTSQNNPSPEKICLVYV